MSRSALVEPHRRDVCCCFFVGVSNSLPFFSLLFICVCLNENKLYSHIQHLSLSSKYSTTLKNFSYAHFLMIVWWLFDDFCDFLAQFYKYLEEHGVDDEHAAFLDAFATLKERRNYADWLKSVGKFLDAWGWIMTQSSCASPKRLKVDLVGVYRNEHPCFGVGWFIEMNYPIQNTYWLAIFSPFFESEKQEGCDRAQKWYGNMSRHHKY